MIRQTLSQAISLPFRLWCIVSQTLDHCKEIMRMNHTIQNILTKGRAGTISLSKSSGGTWKGWLDLA